MTEALSIPDNGVVRVDYEGKPYFGLLRSQDADILTLRSLSREHWTVLEIPSPRKGSVVRFYPDLSGESGMALLMCLEKDYGVWSTCIDLLTAADLNTTVLHSDNLWIRLRAIDRLKDAEALLVIAKTYFPNINFYIGQGDEDAQLFVSAIPRLEDKAFLSDCLVHLEMRKVDNSFWKGGLQALKDRLRELDQIPPKLSGPPYRS